MQEICIVIPCYNEEHRLQVSEFEAYIQSHANVSLCFVNDGSKDNTLTILKNLKDKFPENIDFLNLEINSGKAEAVRQGMLHVINWKTFDYIGFFDADLATPLTELDRFIEISQQGYSIILGSRVKRLGAHIVRSAKRHILGRIFATFASMVLKMGTYDTQCGAKLIKTSLVNDIFKDPFISKWIFDIEILFRAKRLIKDNNNECFFELPLSNWEDKKKSKISPAYFFKVPLDLWKIKRKYT